MIDMFTRKTASAFIIVLLTFKLHAVTVIDFYAAESSSQDTNMITMTTDLFYSQCQSLSGFNVVDKRDVHFDRNNAGPEISFYPEIEETSDGWSCTLNAYNAFLKKNVQFKKQYASYYKILVDAKASIENLFASVLTPDDSRTGDGNSNSAREIKLEELAGTWSGESLVDKIIILRGGKGFVVFKNGATMNISLTLDSDTLTVKQNSKPNASFFPELPRSTALKNISRADPIEWTLTLSPEGFLTGTKKTLTEDKTSATGVKQSNVPVEWKKKE